MAKVLIITKTPNIEAATLTHSELFDITKNTFSQFVGRPILGSESCFRQYFSENHFMWMHAEGSSCHGNREEDGRKAIIGKINTGEYPLIVAFGESAARVFMSRRQANYLFISEIMRKGPVLLAELPGAHVDNFGRINARVALLPHPSGQAQDSWMRYAGAFSDCLSSLQREAMQVIRDGTCEPNEGALRQRGE